MKNLLICALLLLLAAPVRAALTPVEIATITDTILSARVAELPFVVSKLVRDARPNNRQATARLAIEIVAVNRPAVLDVILAEIPAGNRPPITPGNDNGNRPIIPPGQIKYGQP